MIPARKLKLTEKRVFDRASKAFAHLRPEDAEPLTAYAEQMALYEAAKRATEKQPTVDVPQFNRTTGNQVGVRAVRNPAFATMGQALTQTRVLERRLSTLNDKRRMEAEREQRRKKQPKKAPSWATEQARSGAAYELGQSVEAEIKAGTFEVTDERVESLGEDLINVGLTLPAGSPELRDAVLVWLESRYWAVGQFVILSAIDPALLA